MGPRDGLDGRKISSPPGFESGDSIDSFHKYTLDVKQVCYLFLEMTCLTKYLRKFFISRTDKTLNNK